MTDDYRRGFWSGVAVGAMLIIASLFFIQSVHGQTLDTGSSQGILDTSGWRSAEYSLAQTYQQGRALDMIYGPEWRQYSGDLNGNQSAATQCGPGSDCSSDACRTSRIGGGLQIGGIRQQVIQQPVQQPTRQQQTRDTNQYPPCVLLKGQCADGSTSLWSGVIVYRLGTSAFIATCQHPFREKINYIEALVPKWGKLEGRLEAMSEPLDVAIIAINDPGVGYFELAGPSQQDGSRVWYAGYGIGGTNWRWMFGQVSGQNGTDGFYVTGRVELGDSGGPTMDTTGKVVGIIKGYCPDGTNYIVSCTAIRTVLDSVLTRYNQGSASAPASTVPLPQEGSAAGNATADAAGANAEALILKMAESLEAIHAEVVAIKARDATVIKQEVSQAVTQQVTVQAEANRQLIDKELVPLKSRVDKLEGEMLGVQEQLKAPALVYNGEKGDTGPPGQCDVDTIVAAVLAKIQLPNPQPEGITHLVLVRDKSADYWPRMNDELKRARGHYSAIREWNPPMFSTQLPALVAYKGGDAVLTITGLRDVSEALTKIARDEFSLLKEPEHGA